MVRSSAAPSPVNHPPRPVRPRRTRGGVLALAVAVTAGLLAAPRARAACADFDHSHAAWTAILAANVDAEGRVDYEALKKPAGREAIRAYQRQLQAVDAACYEGFTDARKIAFLVNAYNVFTIDLVLEHHPLDSISEIGLVPFWAFRKDFVSLPAIDEDEVSLNFIEHDTLRVDFAEPRIHFAVNCASVSCPVLRREAYRGADLDAQLDAATRAFLHDRSRNRIDAADGTIEVSALFDWFEEDFVKAAGSVAAFVATFEEGPNAEALRRPDLEVDHLEYDWDLNGQGP